MNLKKRERYLVWGVGGVIGLAVLNWMFIRPLLDKASDAKSQRQLAEAALASDESLYNNAVQLNAKWAQMKASGLKEDPYDSEQQAYQVLGDCATQEGLKPKTLKKGRSENVKQFERITFNMTIEGDLRSLSRCLYRIQTAAIPMRVTQLSVSSRKDGADELTMQLTVSTLRLLPDKKAPSNAGRTVAMAEGYR